jgi:membrane protein
MSDLIQGAGSVFVERLRLAYRIALDAFYGFIADDGWAIASHIALSCLMALFPFLLVVTALAGFFGSRSLGEEAARLLLETWPTEVAGPIALEITGVLSSARGDILTLSLVLSIYFASSGVESLRIGLNRSYNMVEVRAWWLLRLESIGYVMGGALVLLVFSLLVVLAPLIWAGLLKYLPGLQQFGALITFARFAVAGLVLVIALLIVHLWLPTGRRRIWEVAPGIAATLVLWLLAGAIFGRYLTEFAFTYAIYYAGLASAMITLVFLYLCSSIFLYGGELNAAIDRARRKKIR